MENNDNSLPNQNKPKKPLSAALYIFVFITVVLLSCAAYIGVYAFMPSFKTQSVYEHFENLKRDKINIVFGEQIVLLESYPINKNDVYYIPVDFVKEYLDQYIYWDKKLNKLIITTENKVIRMKTDELEYFVNNEPLSLNLPVHEENGMAYLPQGFVSDFYNMDITYSPKYNVLIIDDKQIEKTLGAVSSKTKNDVTVRYEPSIKSAIAEKVPIDSQFVLYEQIENFIRVRTPSGIIGYINTDTIGEKFTVPSIAKDEPTETYTKPTINGKIILLWDQVFNEKASSSVERRSAEPEINVLSPTWFSFEKDDYSGDIVNIGDKDYVNAAHKNGYQVWALITDNFNSKTSHAILSNTDVREHVIKQLLAFVSIYDLDGINIDFEAVQEKDAEHYLQFLRELKPLLSQQGAILSVDMYVPLHTKYYNRTEVQKTVDYVCVMAYDEHYSGSETTGPVASLGFVDTGISATLEEVPKEKVLMGIPFYVRVWRVVEKDGIASFKKEDMTMQAAYNKFMKNGAEFKWLEDIGYYYAQYETTEGSEKVKYEVWLEDEKSISQKLLIAEKYDVAGIACWKRWLEKDEVWEEIRKYKEK